jgi:hypothetical protein
MEFTAVPDDRGVRYPQTSTQADRHSSQLEEAQRLRLVQAVAEFLPNGAGARDAGTCGGTVASSRPVYVRPETSASSMTVNGPAENASRSAAVPTADGDSRQADYFLHLLVQNCRQLDRRIDEYQRVIAIAETSGAVQRARGIRPVMRIEEHERQTVQALIDCLQRRFPLPSPREVPSSAPARRLVAR